MPREYYERNLPHYHPAGAALFLTCRLAGSLPQSVLLALQQELAAARQPVADEPAEAGALREQLAQRQYFAQFEAQLERGGYGPDWLHQPAIAANALKGLQQQAAQGHYALLAACAMPNHLHALVHLPEEMTTPFHRTLQRWKSATAVHNNRLLGRTGAFWQSETYDHVVRGAHEQAALGRVVRYIANNPVKAGLCAEWHLWPATYVSPEWQVVI